MVLTQKPFSVQNDKCLEIQTNTEDIEDNKICLQSLKSRDTLRYLKTHTMVILTAGPTNGKMLANGTLANGSTVTNAGAVVSGTAGFSNGFQQFPVAGIPATASNPTVLTGLKTNKLVIVPTGAPTTPTTAEVISVSPTITTATDGTYTVSAYTVNFFAVAAAGGQTITFTADVYEGIAQEDE